MRISAYQKHSTLFWKVTSPLWIPFQTPVIPFECLCSVSTKSLPTLKFCLNFMKVVYTKIHHFRWLKDTRKFDLQNRDPGTSQKLHLHLLAITKSLGAAWVSKPRAIINIRGKLFLYTYNAHPRIRSIFKTSKKSNTCLLLPVRSCFDQIISMKKNWNITRN